LTWTTRKLKENQSFFFPKLFSYNVLAGVTISSSPFGIYNWHICHFVEGSVVIERCSFILISKVHVSYTKCHEMIMLLKNCPW